MAAVSPDDDSIERYIIYHYRYDPEQHEGRHVVVGAFDNERESEACMEKIQAEINRRRDSGERVDPKEYVSARVREPGHQRRQQNARTLKRAIRHGVLPRDWEEYELPAGVGVLSVGGSADSPSRRRRLPGLRLWRRRKP